MQPRFKSTSSRYRIKVCQRRNHYDTDVIIVPLMASGKNMKNFKYCHISLKMLDTGGLCAILGFTATL